MADQNITALPIATTPESSDQILLVGATEEKLIDYDKLADAILNKLTSKNFGLDQGAKTLLQALNELNSKTSRVGQRLQLNWRDGDAKNPSGLEIIVDAKVALILSSDALIKVK